jgi:hypothetical protein
MCFCGSVRSVWRLQSLYGTRLGRETGLRLSTSPTLTSIFRFTGLSGSGSASCGTGRPSSFERFPSVSLSLFGFFTLIVRELCLHVRSKGVRLRAYLDDWLISAGSRQLCQVHTSLLLDVSLRLGFLFIYRKSNLAPRSLSPTWGWISSQSLSLSAHHYPEFSTPGTSLLSSQEEGGLGSYSDVSVG